MNYRLATLAALVAALAVAPAARAEHDDDKDHDDDTPRFEVTFLAAFDTLTGDAADYFENGPYAGFGFEYALNDPRKKDVYRSFNLRLTGGYAGWDGAFYDAKLEGTVFTLDALLVFNAGKVFKPYAFLGTGITNISDDLDIVTGSDGLGFAFGGGTKMYFGDHFLALAEVGFHDFTTEGSYAFSPAHVSWSQIRVGVGARF